VFIAKKNSINSFIKTIQNGNLAFLNAKKKEKIYVLETKRFLEFPVPDSLEGLRLSLRPVIKESLSFEQETLLYKIYYKLVDKDDQVLEERDYWVYHDIDANLVIEAQKRFFYEKKGLQPIHPKPIFLPLGKKAREGKVFVKLVEEDPNVEEVLITTKFREKFPDYRKRPGWERMPKHLKETISEENIYKLRHLSKKEQDALTLNKWRPIAPAGVPDQNFEENLFFEDTEWIDESGGMGGLKLKLPKDGILIGPNRHFLSTNPVKSKLTLSFIEAKEPIPQTVDIKWYGREVYEQKLERININAQESITVDVDPGIVEIISPTYTFLTVKRHNSIEEPISLTEPKVTTAYIIDSQKPVIYKNIQSPESQAVYRFDFRSRVEDQSLNLGKNVRILEVDKNGDLVQTHSSQIPNEVSNYEFDRRRLKRRFSRPHPVFIYPKPETRSFIIKGETLSMVKAFSRPLKHRKVNFVPHDFFKPHNVLADEPGWFSIFPVNKISLEQNGLVAFYRSQRFAPERKEYLINGDYDLQGFRPTGKWSGQSFLIEMKNPNYKAKANSIVFSSVALNEKKQIQFASTDEKESFKPLLILKGGPSTAQKVQIRLNGKEILNQTVTKGKAHLRLPTLKPGSYQVEVLAPLGFKAFINFTKPEGKVYLKKTAFLLRKNSPLNFEFKKRNEQETNLSIRVFQREDQKSHIRIQTDTKDLRNKIVDALDTSTLPLQEWNTGPDPNHKDFIFNNLEKINSGTPFSIFFGKDFSQKNTNIKFKLTEGEQVYIGVFELAPKGEIDYNESSISIEQAQ